MAYKTNRGIINLQKPREFQNEDGSVSKVYPASFNVEGTEYLGNAYPQYSKEGDKIIKITLKLKQTDININEIYD